MIKVVKVPEKEAYYFCKRLFFSVFGNACMAFANCLENLGWVGHPYYGDSSDEVTILYFADDIERLDEICNSIYTAKQDVVIITDLILSDIDFSEKYAIYCDNIIDLTDLEEYYNTELNLDKFIKNILE